MMDFDEYNFEEDLSDLAKEKQLGFFHESAIYFKPDFGSAARMAGELFTGQKWFVDEDDYEWLITALAADEEKKRLAWVEWRFKEESGEREYHNYYLEARQATGEFWRWEIETYNPYFGCDVKFLGWLENAVILVYEDKHDTFVARLDENGVARAEISADWKIADGVLSDEKKLRTLNLLAFESEK